MNSLDAILAMAALLAGFTVLLGAVVDQKDAIDDASYSLKAKSEAINCALVIDSIYSNSTYNYTKDVACAIENGKALGGGGALKKSAAIIATAKKSSQIEVTLLEHYTK